MAEASSDRRPPPPASARCSSSRRPTTTSPGCVPSAATPRRARSRRGSRAGLRRYLLAALADRDAGLAGRPAPVRRRRRPRGPRPRQRARRLPRAAARPPLPVARHRLRVAPRAAAAPRRPADRRARRARRGRRGGEPPDRRRQRRRARRGGPRRLAAPRPASRSTRGEEIDLTDVAELLAGAGYERCEQVTDRGQFAVRGGILDVFGSTEDQAARIELFGDEIESIRLFSTFTQRSLGDADRIELDPAAEIDPDHRVLAEAALADPEDDGDEPAEPLAELLPTDRFSPFLDLIDERTAIVDRRRRGDRPRRSTTTSPTSARRSTTRTSRRLYVGVSEPLARALGPLAVGQPGGREHSFRASTPVSAARSLGEAEPELEKQLRSGYVTVVAFERIGEAERARYALERLTPAILRADAPAPRRRPPCSSPRRRSPTASSRPRCSWR